MKSKIEILSGLECLIMSDSYLLSNNLSERSLTHKLGEHYQHYFPMWNVDCEYNKNLSTRKEIIIDSNAFLSLMGDYIEEYLQKRDRSFTVLKDYTSDQIKGLLKQLRDPKIEYDENMEIIYFVLELTNGSFIRKPIFPDIIVHHRGTTDNFIVVEAKKTINTDKRDRLYDLVKLITLVRSPEYNYKQGVFIDLPVGDDFNNLKTFSIKQNVIDKRVHEILPEYY